MMGMDYVKPLFTICSDCDESLMTVDVVEHEDVVHVYVPPHTCEDEQEEPCHHCNSDEIAGYDINLLPFCQPCLDNPDLWT